MKPHRLYIIMCILSLLSFAGCRDEEPVQSAEGKRTITVNLGIAMSRVVLDDTDLGDDSQPTDMKVWIFNHKEDGSDEKLDYAYLQDENELFFSGSDALGELVNTIERIIEVGDDVNELHVYIVMNNQGLTQELTDASTPNNIKTAIFTNQKWTEDNKVPIYGFGSLPITEYKKSYSLDIKATRAVGKLELFFTRENANSSLTINSIKLEHMPDKGYLVAPTSYVLTYKSSIDLLPEERGIDIDAVLTTDQASTTGNFSEIYEQDNTTFQRLKLEQSYLLENPNGDTWTEIAENHDYVYPEESEIEDKETRYMMTVNYTLGSAPAVDKVVYLPKIVRNEWNKIFARVKDNGELEIRYKVIPWNLVESSIGYAPQPASTTVNPFFDDNDYDEFMKNGYILLPVDEFKNNEVNNVPYDRTTVRKLFKFLYDYPADRGDDDARYCILTKPTYVDADRKILKTGTAGARYFFMLTGPEGATWEAHLSNYEEDGGDFTFSYRESNDFNGCKDEGYTGKVKMVSHGIARPKPYIIQVNCVRSWTGTDETATTDANDKATGKYPWYEEEGNDYWDDANDESRVDDIDDDSEDSWWEKDNRRDKFYNEYDQELRDAFTYYTAWGKENNAYKREIATKLYITVTLADGTKYNLNINPSYKNHRNISNMAFLYGDDEGNWRRYAGEDDFIWIRQVPAQFDWSFEELARDADEGEKGENTWDNYQWWRENPYWKKKEVN